MTGSLRGFSAGEMIEGLKSPDKLLDALRARWQLRSCSFVPRNVRVKGRVIVQNHGSIILGERVRMDGRVAPIDLAAWSGSELMIGAGTYINFGASISSARRVTIGERCLIGTYAMIMDTDYHDTVNHRSPGKSAPIIIEDDVWIAARAIILKGVTLGRGSVIGAGSVVTSDIPAGAIAFGVPAQVIKSD